jgi:hypothetical protein
LLEAPFSLMLSLRVSPTYGANAVLRVTTDAWSCGLLCGRSQADRFGAT